MKQLLKCVLILTLIIICHLPSQAQGIEFETGAWAEVLTQAKEQNKPIFVNAYTQWSRYSEWMDKNVYAQEDIGTVVHENFVPYKMDLGTEAGKAFAAKHNIRTYPTYFFFDKEGELLHKAPGARRKDDFKALCAAALDPAKQSSGFVKKYEAGEKSKDFLKAYLVVLMDMKEDLSQPFNDYWSQLSIEEKTSEESFKLLAATSSGFKDLQSVQFRFLKDNKAAFEKTLGAEKVQTTWNQVYYVAESGLELLFDTKEQNSLLKAISTNFPNHKKEAKANLTYIRAVNSEDPKKIAAAREKYMVYCSNWRTLNSEAWSICENEKATKEDYELGLLWVNKSVQLQESFYNLDTKAYILFKMEDYNAAKEVCEKAIKMAPEGKAGDTEKLLESINEKLGGS